MQGVTTERLYLDAASRRAAAAAVAAAASGVRQYIIVCRSVFGLDRFRVERVRS